MKESSTLGQFSQIQSCGLRRHSSHSSQLHSSSFSPHSSQREQLQCSSKLPQSLQRSQTQSASFSSQSSQKPQVQALAGRAQTPQILSIGSIFYLFFIWSEGSAGDMWLLVPFINGRSCRWLKVGRFRYGQKWVFYCICRGWGRWRDKYLEQ